MKKHKPQPPKFQPGDKVRCHGTVLEVESYSEKLKEYICWPSYDPEHEGQPWFVMEKDLESMEGEIRKLKGKDQENEDVVDDIRIRQDDPEMDQGSTGTGQAATEQGTGEGR